MKKADTKPPAFPRPAKRWRIWPDTTPDLLLLDDGLPDMNGKEFLEACKTTGLLLPPFIVATGHGDERVAVEMMKLGARDYIVKDSNFLDLLPEIVRRVDQELESERKLQQSEKALRETETRFRALADLLPQMVYEADDRGNLTYVNRVAFERFGYTPQDLERGINVLHVLAPKDRERAARAIQEIVAGTAPEGGREYCALRRDGRTFPVLVYTAPIVQNGRVTGLRGLVVDITAQKQAEEKLLASEEKYRSLVEQSLQGMVIARDNPVQIVFASQPMQAITGFSPQELTGLGSEQIVELIHPEDRETFFSNFRSRLAGKPIPPRHEYRAIHKDKTMRWVEIYSTRIEYENSPATQTIFLDITDRKRAAEALHESEERYRELADSITDVFFAMDANLSYTYWNRASEKLTGIPSKEAMGKSLFDIFPDTPQTRKAERIYRDVLKTQEPRTFVNEYQLEEKNLFLEISVYPSKHGLSVFVKNITERKQTEEDLKASQEYVRNIIDSSLDMIIALNMERRIVEFNKAAQETFGYLPEEVLGKHVDMLYADPREGLRIHQATVRDGQCVQEVLNKRKDDQVFPCFLSASGLRNARGELVGIMGVSRDITARKQAEMVLAQSEKKFRTIMEQMSDIVFVTDDKGVITYISPAIRDIFGFMPAVVQGRRFTEFLDPSEIDRAASLFTKTMSTGAPCTHLELGMKRKDGSVFIGELNATRYQTEGFAGTIGLIRDITERKQAEEHLSLLAGMLDIAPNSITIHDFNGKFLYANQKTFEMHQYEAHEFMALNLHEIDVPESEALIASRMTQIQDIGEAFFEVSHVRKDKSVFPMEISVKKVTWAGKPAILSVGTDITERKRAAEVLHMLNEDLELRVSQRTAELEAANRELQEFAYIVSHDLKAPLRGICQLAQWLREDYAQVLDEEGRAQIDLLMSRVRRMEKLISGILHYSRATHGSEYEEQIDLNTLVPQVIDMLSPPPHITIRIEQTLPVVHGDPIRITQVFQNLLNNAIKFMDKPDGQITIDCVDSGEVWVFGVEDNGPGIEPRHHERIFHIFQSCTPRDERESTGIGLTVVKKIVEFYGGRIWVESEPGRGSRFLFTWPNIKRRVRVIE